MLGLPALVEPHLAAGRGNPDGMHRGWEAHAAVGHALAEAVRVGLSARGTLAS